MATEEPMQDMPQVESQDSQMEDTSDLPTAPAAMATKNKKRPRIDFAVESRERKRGKTMFGLVLGTLNKAKNEDKERNASEAAKKRQLIEQRLQDKLRKETDSVRRAEEAKKDKTLANRKEEDLQLKDSIYKLRRTRLPLLSNFLLTSDSILSEDATPPPPTNNPPIGPARSHPPPLYYLPAILTPAQETFLQRRKAEVKEAAEKEWTNFHAERTAGIEEINQLRQRVAEEEVRRKTERQDQDVEDASTAVESAAPGDTLMATESEDKPVAGETTTVNRKAREAPAQMDVDEGSATPSMAGQPKAESGKDEGGKGTTAEHEIKEESAPMQADDDDAVEY
ncbi:hypothetical protein A0H81_14128 [Grifola frondosa]|uniref:Pinin/SDK/MemA protein domain-containing protein n=1 Tax=Grifola frondosa TaxID=5627 RepID=A0A1C7LM51_GRIFR|nr:hypothetical protein A0H81_14128 [Grifola frondosa]